MGVANEETQEDVKNDSVETGSKEDNDALEIKKREKTVDTFSIDVNEFILGPEKKRR